MTDMDAFDRLIAREVLRASAAPRPVDDLAIFESVTATSRSPRWGFSMFSALRFVAAAVIVALFGGLLLAGILTTQQGDDVLPASVTPSSSPMTSEELLSTMVTEEVEPGVFRVSNDGLRDLEPDATWGVVVGQDGSVWLESSGQWLQLGVADPQTTLGHVPGESGVAPDGLLWSVAGSSVYSFDGTSWTEWGTDATSLRGLAVTQDGNVWVTDGNEQGETTGLYRLADGSLTAAPDWTEVHPRAAGPHHLAVAPDGDVWLIGETEPDLPGFDNGGPTVDAFLRFDGNDWELVAAPDDLRYLEGQSIDVGADGTLWAAVGNPSQADDGLARLDDAGWTVFTEAHGVRPWGLFGFVPTDHLHAAPDGSVWVNAEGASDSCGGVANFDGTTWTGFLSSLCVYDMDVAPDGAVWVQAGDSTTSDGFEVWEPLGTYVITPEAVAVAEPSPRTALESLSDMVTEEVEPGVLHVVDDGVRDVRGLSGAPAGVAAVPDGGVLVFDDDGFFRLGQSNRFPPTRGWMHVVAGDGTPWEIGEGSGVRSFDGRAWVERMSAPRPGSEFQSIAADDGGSVWVLSRFDDGSSGGQHQEIHQIEPDGTVMAIPGWSGLHDGRIDGLGVSPDGEIWLSTAPYRDPGGGQDVKLLHFDGQAWEMVDGPTTISEPIAFGPDGTLWAGLQAYPRGGVDPFEGLARLKQSGWSVFTAADGVEGWGGRPYHWSHLHVDGAGRAWVPVNVNNGVECDGVASFDGTTWATYLDGLCSYWLDVTPDGAVWVVAHDDWDPGLYVITPEAVAASD